MDLIGQKFGRWTVTGTAEKRPRNYRRYWLCVCDCGTEREVLEQNMTRVGPMRSVSCGCHNKEKNRKDGQQAAWNKLVRHYRTSASKRSLDFSLTVEDVQEICSKPCHYCGEPPREYQSSRTLYLASCINKRTKEPDMDFADSKVIMVNTIDRVDSSKGYIINNIVPCCIPCNCAKLDRTVDQFLSWARKLVAHSKNQS